MRMFTMYRRADITDTHDANQANPPDEPQFEGVVFTDGSCVIRWRTLVKSTSVWDSFDAMMAIHGHPEYDSELVWNDAEENVEVCGSFGCTLPAGHNRGKADVPENHKVFDTDFEHELFTGGGPS